MKKLKAIIVEDEAGAAEQLRSVIRVVDPTVQVLAVLGSIAESVKWIGENECPDIGFFDIRLEDGLSFEIFRQCSVQFPVIFTTAYDQYAIDAFQVLSIDYLLKPVKESALKNSISKYRQLTGYRSDEKWITRLIHEMEIRSKRVTLLIQVKDRLLPVAADEFACFYLQHGIVYGKTFSNQTYPVDYTLEELLNLLNTSTFFRANRQVIVNRTGIREAEHYFNGRLSLKLVNGNPLAILISKARVAAFKEWWAFGG